MAATIPGPAVVLDARDCAGFADLIDRALAAAESRGEPVPAHISSAAAQMRRVSAYYRRQVAIATPEFRSLDSESFETVEWISVKEVAELLGTSEQNVSARCRRGSLQAKREGGRWLVDRATVLRKRSC